MPSSTISSKGQVTVPIEVRHRLGLKAGDKVEFAFEEGKTVLRPVLAEEDPWRRTSGRFRHSPPEKRSSGFTAIFAGMTSWTRRCFEDCGRLQHLLRNLVQ